MKFKLLTHIDRVNYFSDGFIEYYKNLFDLEEFYFLIHSFNHKKILNYLISHGFNESQTILYKDVKYSRGNKKNIQYQKQKELIKQGYTVVYSSQDERIVHSDLKNYISNNLKDYMVPRGVVIIQHASESKLDVTKPLLSQRSYQIKNVSGRSKPQILKNEFKWDNGMHKIPKNAKIDENIYLVDIGKCCADIALENNIQSTAMYNTLPNYYDVCNLNTIKKLFFRRNSKDLPEELKRLPNYF